MARGRPKKILTEVLSEEILEEILEEVEKNPTIALDTFKIKNEDKKDLKKQIHPKFQKFKESK